jgi:hypothetical protein
VHQGIFERSFYMATSTFALWHANPVQVYFYNLGRAARTFGAALIAAAPQPPEIETTAQPNAAHLLSPDTAASRSQAAEALNALASQFDATQPNQAAELRWLASRG